MDGVYHCGAPAVNGKTTKISPGTDTKVLTHLQKRAKNPGTDVLCERAAVPGGDTNGKRFRG